MRPELRFNDPDAVALIHFNECERSVKNLRPTTQIFRSRGERGPTVSNMINLGFTIDALLTSTLDLERAFVDEQSDAGSIALLDALAAIILAIGELQIVALGELHRLGG